MFIRWRTLSPESAGISLITDDGLSHEQLEILRSGDLLKSDMTMYLHHTIPRQHCVEKIDRFLLKLKWLPISAETELVSALNEVGPGRTQQKNIAMVRGPY